MILMMENMRNLKIQIGRSKKDIAIVIGWASVISLLMIKTHQFFYLENEKFTYYKISWLEYEGPKFVSLDLLLLLIISFLVGIIITEAKSMIYGYFASMFLSSSIGMSYIFLFNWFVLGLGETLLKIPFGWELGLLIAFLNVFRFMFPIGMFCCFIGIATGSFIRTWL